MTRLQPPRLVAPALPTLTAADPTQFATGLDGVRLADADLGAVHAREVYFRESELVNVRLDGARLGGSRFLDLRIDGLDAPDLDAARSVWRDCALTGSRLGSVGLFGAEISSVRVTGCKIGYLGLQGAQLSDVVFEDCTIEELDASDAVLTRVAFIGTILADLRLPGSRLGDVDLREAALGAITPVTALTGATVSSLQLIDLAPMLAQGLGIGVD